MKKKAKVIVPLLAPRIVGGACETFRESERLSTRCLLFVRIVRARLFDKFRKYFLALRLLCLKEHACVVRAVPRTARIFRKFAKTRTKSGEQDTA